MALPRLAHATNRRFSSTLGTSPSKGPSPSAAPPPFSDVLACDALLSYSLGDGTASDLLRELGDRRPRVALVLSGFDASEDVTRTLDAGFDAHLVKPTSIDVLRETLAEGLRRSPSGVRLVSRSADSVPGSESTGTSDATCAKRR